MVGDMVVVWVVGNSMYGNNMGYGSSMGMGYGGMGYGSGSMMSMGYGMGGMGMGYGMSSMYGSGYGMGYSPFMMGGMGIGYNPYGMGMMGYSPYGMGYSPYGMSMYSPYSMGYGGGYVNPYDYNSVSSYNGPRTSPGGGNSAITSNSSGSTTAPRGPLREENPNGAPKIAPGVSPLTPERFNQVSIPKENMEKIAEAKSPTRFSPEYQPVRNNYSSGMQENNTIRQNNYNSNPTRANSGENNVGSRSRVSEESSQQRPTRWYNSSSENNTSRSNDSF